MLQVSQKPVQGLARNLSVSRALQNENSDGPKPLTMLTDDERMMKETGKQINLFRFPINMFYKTFA